MTGEVLENCWVNVSDGYIESLSSKPAFETEITLPPKSVVLPGVVNAHTHLELSQIAMPLNVPSRTMSDWVAALLQFRRSPQYDAATAIRLSLQNLREANQTVGVGDIVPSNLDTSTFGVAANVPIWFAFAEWIAWREDQVARLEPNTIYAGISPHAPQTVCPALLEKIVRLNVPVAMHLAETEEELQLLRHASGPLVEMMRRADPDYQPEKVVLGKRPLDYLRFLSPVPKAFIIHGNYLDDEELRFLAKHRETMSVVYCPRSHHYFQHKKYPLRKMLDLGIRVLLGTDSTASAPDIDLTNEIRFAVQQHTDVRAEEIYKMATLAGADAFGFPNCGKIAAGERAVFAVL
ncbi:chlorohydrolase [Planctomycetales bacterium]|nr:chlorohydrolase [Planctomycetales bacterium]